MLMRLFEYRCHWYPRRGRGQCIERLAWDHWLDLPAQKTHWNFYFSFSVPRKNRWARDTLTWNISYFEPAKAWYIVSDMTMISHLNRQWDVSHYRHRQLFTIDGIQQLDRSWRGVDVKVAQKVVKHVDDLIFQGFWKRNAHAAIIWLAIAQ